MFMPKPDILLLGNLASSLGFKNIVVDTSNYFITTRFVNDVWSFIRDMGESNYLKTRNKKYSY